MKDILLIQIYDFVCSVYDTNFSTCFQRSSHNQNELLFTDQEAITIWFFGHLQKRYEKKQIFEFIQDYWQEWFPTLPSYQTFVSRLNQLEPSFQTIGGVLMTSLGSEIVAEFDKLTDSMPIMLAKNGHAYQAKVAHEIANIGYCEAKKMYFHGVRLHVIGQKCFQKLPIPEQMFICHASFYDPTAFKEQEIILENTDLFADKAYTQIELAEKLKKQNTRVISPKKKPKGKELTKREKYFNRLISKFRQPIEGFFNWLIEKTKIQIASKVRSFDGLMIHCFGKLAVAIFSLVFNP